VVTKNGLASFGGLKRDGVCEAVKVEVVELNLQVANEGIAMRLVDGSTGAALHRWALRRVATSSVLARMTALWEVPVRLKVLDIPRESGRNRVPTWPNGFSSTVPADPVVLRPL